MQQYQYYHIMRENRPNRPCRFGNNCKYLATGTCLYSHQEPQGQQGSFQSYNNGRQPYRGNAFFEQAPQNRGQSRNQRNNSRNYRQGNHQNMQNGQYYENSFNGSRKMQDPQKSFCFDFQQGRECSFGQNCKRKHQFFYESLQKMRRQQFSRQYPKQFSSNISKIETPEGEILAFREGNVLSLMQYDFQNNTPVTPQFITQLTPSKQKVQFYNQKNGIVYFSYLNQFTKLIDVSFINLLTSEKITIANSHTDRVTSFQHFSNEILISSTMGGEIKIWWMEQGGFVIHQQLTDMLASNYKNGTDSFDILYLDVTVIEGDRIILAGTSDGRVLFWRGNDIAAMSFMSYCFHPDHQALVYQALLYQMSQGIGLVALTWNKTSTASAIVFVDLNNQKEIFKKQFNSNQSPDLLLTTFQVMEDYILLANKKGEVKIYHLRESFKKVGEIYHKNTISSTVFSRVEVKSTNVFLKLLYILQKASKDGPGSFSIYLIQ